MQYFEEIRIVPEYVQADRLCGEGSPPSPLRAQKRSEASFRPDVVATVKFVGRSSFE